MGRNEATTTATWVLKTLSAQKFLEPLREQAERRFCARVSGSALTSGGRGVGGVLYLHDVAPPTLCRRVAMATGRARLLHQHWLGVQALRLPPGGLGAAPGSSGFR